MKSLLLVCVALVIGGCLVFFLESTDVSKSYVQTWPKSYASTSCAEWRSAMDDDQKFATAGDFLRDDLRRNGSAERPDYGPIDNYRQAVNQVCAAHHSWTLARVGVDVGLAD